MPPWDQSNVSLKVQNPPARPRAGGDDVAEAIAAWRRAGGEQFVKSDAAILERYGRTTGTTAHRPVAVLYPESTAQVQEALRIASAFEVGVYPISRGKNWGYGDACPLRANHAVLDLGRMNRIVEVNQELCYAVIEPGVTQGQLYKHLCENSIGLWMDVSGAGCDASIVGNALDRGFGHTRYGDHFLTTCGMQVVLADGRLLNTGLGHYPDAKAARAYRYGTGPFVDGLFSQSNFGIVTQMGIWLMPKPAAFAAFFVSAPEAADLADLVNRLAALKIQGLLQSAVHIGNDLRVISGKMSYPWERARDQTPLPENLRAELRRELDIGAWNVGGALSGSKQTVSALRGVLKRALLPHKVVFVDDRKLATATKAQRLLARFGMGKRLRERLEAVAPIYGLLKGIPTDEPLRGAAWRVRGIATDRPRDPLDCHAGLLWISPVLPATGSSASEVMGILEPISRKHGFDPCATFTFISDRALVCVANLAFDRREAQEVEKAKECYEELTDALMARGYIPYRSGPEGMSKLFADGDVFWEVSSQIKAALDPGGIISGGRYEPPRPVRCA
jgi:4-cresol dehydrogenase (hydroxylating)